MPAATQFLLILLIAIVQVFDSPSVAQDQAVDLDDDRARIAALARSAHRAQVTDFLSETPTRATGMSMDASLAKLALNGIDGRKEAEIRSSVVRVFGFMARDEKRDSGDRTYAMNKLGRLAQLHADVAKEVAAVMNQLAEHDDRRIRGTAELILSRIKDVPVPMSAVETLAELERVVDSGDLDKARSMFHLVNPEEATDEFISMFRDIPRVVTSKEILDIAVIVVHEKRNDYDPVCLIRMSGQWKVCQPITQFTIPATDIRKAKSMIETMDTLMNWYEEAVSEERRKRAGQASPAA